mmetsp:Transcript_1144/g.2706  ORF Transcript_1144/g.2706 Transcript_1144/m.2706 type:complete len:106 (-) Transcript_1144:768-1085(-)
MTWTQWAPPVCRGVRRPGPCGNGTTAEAPLVRKPRTMRMPLLSHWNRRQKSAANAHSWRTNRVTKINNFNHDVSKKFATSSSTEEKEKTETPFPFPHYSSSVHKN